MEALISRGGQAPCNMLRHAQVVRLQRPRGVTLAVVGAIPRRARGLRWLTVVPTIDILKMQIKRQPRVSPTKHTRPPRYGGGAELTLGLIYGLRFGLGSTPIESH